MSSDYAVSISLGVCGRTTVAVALLTMMHNSADEDCDCDECNYERKAA